MADIGNHRRAGGLAVRRTMALAVTASLLMACSPQENPGRDAARTAAGSPTSVGPDAGSEGSPTSAGQVRARVPVVPSTSEPAVLADQLDRAAATLRNQDAREVDVRRAGEFQQLAVRALATASDAFRRRVMRRLDPQTAVMTGPAVRASRQLHGLTSPQPKLPRWRIVAPPPAAELRGHYRAAQRRTGVPWTYLAAIHLVETRMGRIRGTSTAGARGPMQFIPATWEAYGAGGDINDPRDAILAAARLLKDHGAPRDMAGALWHYNPAAEYVRAVSAYARTMQRSPSTYRGYWHWRVLYSHERGTYVLPVGYPRNPAVLLPEER